MSKTGSSPTWPCSGLTVDGSQGGMPSALPTDDYLAREDQENVGTNSHHHSGTSGAREKPNIAAGWSKYLSKRESQEAFEVCAELA